MAVKKTLCLVLTPSPPLGNFHRLPKLMLCLSFMPSHWLLSSLLLLGCLRDTHSSLLNLRSSSVDPSLGL